MSTLRKFLLDESSSVAKRLVQGKRYIGFDCRKKKINLVQTVVVRVPAGPAPNTERCRGVCHGKDANTRAKKLLTRSQPNGHYGVNFAYLKKAAEAAFIFS